MNNDTSDVTIRDLDDEECRGLLADSGVGRIAYTFRDRVDIQPLSYAFDDGWIFGRTSHGSKLEMLAHRPWVAFEVDEVVGPFQWRSVVVHGSFNVLADEGGPTDRATYARALRALSRIMPGAFSGDDPVPERTVLFGIAVHEITGRMASPNSR